MAAIDDFDFLPAVGDVLPDMGLGNDTDPTTLDKLDKEAADMQNDVDAQELGSKLIVALRDVVNRSAGDGDTLKGELGTILIELVSALVDERDDAMADSMDATASLNYEQEILHKVAEAFGGKNKHAYNIPILKHMYGQLEKAVGEASKLARSEERGKNWKAPVHKDGRWKGKVRSDAHKSHPSRNAARAVSRERERIEKQYGVTPEQRASGHKLLRDVHRRNTQRKWNDYRERTSKVHTA